MWVTKHKYKNTLATNKQDWETLIYIISKLLSLHVAQKKKKVDSILIYLKLSDSEIGLSLNAHFYTLPHTIAVP